MVMGAGAALAGALVDPLGAAAAAPLVGAAAAGAAGFAAPLAPLLVLPGPQATTATRTTTGIARLKRANMAPPPPPPPALAPPRQGAHPTGGTPSRPGSNPAPSARQFPCIVISRVNTPPPRPLSPER